MDLFVFGLSGFQFFSYILDIYIYGPNSAWKNLNTIGKSELSAYDILGWAKLKVMSEDKYKVMYKYTNNYKYNCKKSKILLSAGDTVGGAKL